MKCNNIGRSMVEMIGVLAIIGVLSVGAIAGYSKAMMKYRLNKMAEQYNYLFHIATDLYKDEFIKLSIKSETITYLYPLLENMKFMPDGMSTSDVYAYDVFNNRSNLRSQNGGIGFYLGMTSNKFATKELIEVCRHFYTDIIMPRKNDIYATGFWYNDSDGSSLTNRMWGDSFCSAGKDCLKNLTLSGIDELCKSGQLERNYSLYIRWK